MHLAELIDDGTPTFSLSFYLSFTGWFFLARERPFHHEHVSSELKLAIGLALQLAAMQASVLSPTMTVGHTHSNSRMNICPCVISSKSKTTVTIMSKITKLCTWRKVRHFVQEKEVLPELTKLLET